MLEFPWNIAAHHGGMGLRIGYGPVDLCSGCSEGSHCAGPVQAQRRLASRCQRAVSSAESHGQLTRVGIRANREEGLRQILERELVALHDLQRHWPTEK